MHALHTPRSTASSVGMPGFTAEASITQATTPYCTVTSVGYQAPRVVPQQLAIGSKFYSWVCHCCVYRGDLLCCAYCDICV